MNIYDKIKAPKWAKKHILLREGEKDVTIRRYLLDVYVITDDNGVDIITENNDLQTVINYYLKGEYSRLNDKINELEKEQDRLRLMTYDF